MFTTVHMRVVVLVLCALTFASALPMVVRSAVLTTPNAPAEETVTEDVQNTVPEPEVSNPYPVDILEGGGKVVGDFVVGPGKVDVSIPPGESQTVEMTVANRTGMRRQFKITVEDAQGSTDTNQPIILLGDEHGPYTMKDYVSVPQMTFELNDGERARVPVTISIPPDADPGGHYGSVLVQTLTVEETNSKGTNAAPRSAIISRIGTLFFITVPGNVKHEGVLKRFSTIPEQQIFQSGPVHFGIFFENTGDIHLAPYGEVRITNMLDEEVGFLELEPWFVLPKSQRLREIVWDRDFLFGKYTATARINRSYDDVVDTKAYTFWVLPWKIVLGAFAVLFIIIFVIRGFFKTFEFKRRS